MGPFPNAVLRSDFVLAQSVAGAGIDDPDQTFYENYSCKSNRNYTHYCDPEIEKMIDQQSMEPDQAKRKKLVWEIDSKLQQAVARPIEGGRICFVLRVAGNLNDPPASRSSVGKIGNPVSHTSLGVAREPEG
jgi:hypothetical protein